MSFNQDESEMSKEALNGVDDLYYLESQTSHEYEQDDLFYLANKTFYTTCHKISRQNSPSYRKKPPYSLLENWLIHSVFSKSQQILLRFPVIHPRVMMAEGDFIYTPHQIAAEHQQDNYNYYYDHPIDDEEDDDDYDYYDDTFIIGDEGVMVMTASAPDASHFMAEEEGQEHMVMDENMWMNNSRYNNNSNNTLHVMNPDTEEEEDEEDPMYHHNGYKQPQTHFQGQLQMVKEEEEEEEEEEDNGLAMTPKVIEWYRKVELNSIHEEEEEEEEIRIIEEDDTSNSTQSDEKSMTQHSNDSYQSLADIMEEASSRLPNYGTLDRSIIEQPTSSLLQVSVCFVDAAWIALDLAHTYVEDHDKKTISGFMTCMFKIWKVLFLGAETMLGWGNHRLRPQAVV